VTPALTPTPYLYLLLYLYLLKTLAKARSHLGIRSLFMQSRVYEFGKEFDPWSTVWGRWHLSNCLTAGPGSAFSFSDECASRVPKLRRVTSNTPLRAC
jgi:hypothetical protein